MVFTGYLISAKGNGSGSNDLLFLIKKFYIWDENTLYEQLNMIIMKKLLLTGLAVFFMGSVAFCETGKPKHKNPGKGIKKEYRSGAKRTCPNRPGCICH